MNKRRDISYLEDIIEDSFGVCDEFHLELFKNVFSYIVEEIKYDSDSFGYQFPHIGTLYQDYHLYRPTENKKETEEEKLNHLNRIGQMSYFADEKGNGVRNKKYPYMFYMENGLRRKFELPSTKLINAGRNPPIFFAAVERIQNNNFEEHKKKNE